GFARHVGPLAPVHRLPALGPLLLALQALLSLVERRAPAGERGDDERARLALLPGEVLAADEVERHVDDGKQDPAGVRPPGRSTAPAPPCARCRPGRIR